MRSIAELAEAVERDPELARQIREDPAGALRKLAMPERAAALGEQAMERLRAIRSPYVKEVRGRGLLIGIELHPEAGGARRFAEALKERGILVKDTHEHILRFAPPLVISREDLDWALDQIQEVLEG